VRAVPEHQLLVIDCLTLWVSNLMGRNLADEAIAVAAEETAGLLGSRPGGAVVVSNEVGLGIIPDNPLGRRYRDALGRVNATFAAQAQRTVFVVAGRLHELTRAADFIERMAWPAR
jgi:adenosylcobinamide kinase/adenosylcobinamide-phosphate guanylyltransferase